MREDVNVLIVILFLVPWIIISGGSWLFSVIAATVSYGIFRFIAFIVKESRNSYTK